METRRCAYCQKLHRATAQICSRCGQPLLENRAREAAVPTGEITRPALPTASPHRVGHYSGLHPEDQPYQSSKVRIPRAVLEQQIQWQRAAQEPEEILLPEPDDNEPTLKMDRKAWFPTRPPRPRPRATRQKQPAYTAHTFSLAPHAIYYIVASICFIVLLSSSLIAFAQIGIPASASASLVALPDSLRLHEEFTLIGNGFSTHATLTFTHDTNKKLFDGSGNPVQVTTDDQGSFSLPIHVPADWQAGPHTIYILDQAQIKQKVAITVQNP